MGCWELTGRFVGFPCLYRSFPHQAHCRSWTREVWGRAGRKVGESPLWAPGAGRGRSREMRPAASQRRWPGYSALGAAPNLARGRSVRGGQRHLRKAVVISGTHCLPGLTSAGGASGPFVRTAGGERARGALAEGQSDRGSRPSEVHADSRAALNRAAGSAVPPLFQAAASALEGVLRRPRSPSAPPPAAQGAAGASGPWVRDSPFGVPSPTVGPPPCLAPLCRGSRAQVPSGADETHARQCFVKPGGGGR